MNDILYQLYKDTQRVDAFFSLFRERSLTSENLSSWLRAPRQAYICGAFAYCYIAAELPEVNANHRPSLQLVLMSPAI